MTKEIFKKRKIGKHLVNIAMLGLTITPAISAAATVYAEESANEAAASTDVSAQLKAAIEKAKSLGIKVDSTEKKTFQSTAELNDFNAKQLAQLNEAIAKAENDLSDLEKTKSANKQLEDQYQKDQAEYNTKKQTYDQDLKKYESDLKEYNLKKGKPGTLEKEISQNLTFSYEPDAKISFSSNTKFWKLADNDKFGNATGSRFTDFHLDSGGGSLVSEIVDPIVLHISDNLKSYPVVVGPNETIDVTYTGLKNSTYDTKKLSKVKYTFKNLDTTPTTIFVMTDPTNGACVFNFSDRQNGSKVEVNMTFYDEKESVIKFNSDRPALISFSSLNRSIYGIEKITDYNFLFAKTIGSSVQEQSNGYYGSGIYSTEDNEDKSKNSRGWGTADWDDTKNPNFYWGSGVGEVVNGDTIRFVMQSSAGGQWLAFNSKIAAIAKPSEPNKPTPPTPPTQKITNNTADPISVKIAEAVVVNTTHVEVGTNKELAPKEEGTKPKKNIDGYEFVETKTKDGNTIHYYTPKKPEEPKKPDPKPDDKKVFTKHIDITTGKELHQQEEGTKPKRSFDGYEFVETKTKDGNTIHYYKPVDKTPIKPKEDKAITKHFDITTGKEIAPQEDGNQPKKDIPNYEFVETKTKTGETDHYYKPIAKPITRHIDKETGKDIVPPEDGNKPKKDIPGYRFVETKDKEGNTYHYYQKVHTRHIDITTGKELVTQEDGTQPKKDIPGYEFVETKDKDGDTEHFYRPIKKVYTKFIDKSTGKELAPQEDGKQPKREFDGYKFVETVDEDGNTIHYYEPIAKVITKHIDIDTNEEIAPQEDGKQPKKDISGYEFVETKDDNGNTIHYYRKVKKPAAIKGKTPAKYADTNEAAGIVQSVIGALGLTSLAGFGFWKKRKK